MHYANNAARSQTDQIAIDLAAIQGISFRLNTAFRVTGGAGREYYGYIVSTVAGFDRKRPPVRSLLLKCCQQFHLSRARYPLRQGRKCWMRDEQICITAPQHLNEARFGIGRVQQHTGCTRTTDAQKRRWPRVNNLARERQPAHACLQLLSVEQHSSPYPVAENT